MLKTGKQRVAWSVFAVGIITLTAWAWYQLTVVGRHPFSPILQWKQRGAPSEIELWALFSDDEAISITCRPEGEQAVSLSFRRDTPDYEALRELLAATAYRVTDYEDVRKWCRLPSIIIEGSETRCTVFARRRCVEVEQNGRTILYLRRPEYPDGLPALCDMLLME